MLRAMILGAALALCACTSGDVSGGAREAPDASATTDDYDPETDHGEPVESDETFEALDPSPVTPDDLRDEVPDEPAAMTDPGPPEESLGEVETARYALTPDAGGALPCVPGARSFPALQGVFEARWAAVSPEADLYARCGDSTAIQRIEPALSSLVAMYEATAHPEYARRFLRLAELLRAVGVRQGGFVNKGLGERVVASRAAGQSCVGVAGGRFLCLDGCDRAVAGRRTNYLADMYIAEPLLRGLRLILAADACGVPEMQRYQRKAAQLLPVLRGILWQRNRAIAASTREGQFHILARLGAAALQVCLANPRAAPTACAVARAQGSYIRRNLVALPGTPGALVWGSSTGSCTPSRPDFACHTIGGACDCAAGSTAPGERLYDCRGPQARCDPRSPTCWRNRCGVTDVSHANAVVAFAVELHRYAARIGGEVFDDAAINGLAATLRDSIWCGSAAPRGPYAASVFIDGHGACGVAATLTKRNLQRRALALGWFHLGRWAPALLGPMTEFTDDLVATSATRDRAALSAQAELTHALTTVTIPEASLLGAARCRACP